ncbi:hypothetical protein BH11MYX1_BH11MYX1_26100 [soil metagenome]
MNEVTAREFAPFLLHRRELNREPVARHGWLPPHDVPATTNAWVATTLRNSERVKVINLRLARAIAVTVAALGWAPARADGLVIAGASPRAIGRAGVGTVSDDGGGALLLDPAVLARRATTRAQLGIAFADDSVEWLHSPSSPVARDQSGSSAVPMIAVEGAWGEWILGAAALTSAVSERALRNPGNVDAGAYGTLFEYRYAGIAGGLRRDTVTIGAARRIGDSLAVGISIAGSRVSVNETRGVWAGFVDRKDVLGDPQHDVAVALDAEETLSPSAVAGLLVAPPDTHLELAASIGWARTAHVAGTVEAHGIGTGARVQTSSPSVTMDLAEPVTVRTGVRWLADRWVAEANADLWIFPESAETATWKITGLQIIDQSSFGVPLTQLSSRISERTHGALRSAVDLELIEGFLWATVGYAYTTAGTGRGRRSPTFGELSGHTLGLGLETSAGSFTFNLGWSRTWSTKRPEQTSVWRLDNPFSGGDGSVSSGTYDASSDLVGLSIDAELDP